MSSELPQQYPQRHRSSEQDPSSSSTSPETNPPQPSRRSSIPQSTSSEDSQTVLLNHPSSSEPSPNPEKGKQRQSSPRPKPITAKSSKEPKKCWICFGDETEDNPTSSDWRSPCPCALKAHEACLLDWVADLESSKKTGRKIECPQCKTQIRIARPWSPLVGGYQAVERAASRMAVPCLLASLCGTVIGGFWMHGFSTVYFILGPEEAEKVMGIDGFSLNSNWGLALPAIPLALIFSRTTHLDNLFPIIPIFFFASGAPRQDRALTWPPSAAFTMAGLPYVRAIYYELWSRFLEPKEKRWVKEVQPRAGEDEDGAGQEQDQNEDDGANNDMADVVNFELEVDLELVDPPDGERAAQQPEQPVENPPIQAEAGAQAERNQDQAPRNPPWRPPHPHMMHEQPPPAAQGGIVGGANNIIIDILSTGRMIMGALALPLISAGMGGLLKAVLPKHWTTPPTRWQRYPPGFLQSRFGRTIAGGCLFVVLKDTFVLYSKYRTAQDHKHRRVLNYDPRKAKKPEKEKAK